MLAQVDIYHYMWKFGAHKSTKAKTPRTFSAAHVIVISFAD